MKKGIKLKFPLPPTPLTRNEKTTLKKPILIDCNVKLFSSKYPWLFNLPKYYCSWPSCSFVGSLLSCLNLLLLFGNSYNLDLYVIVSIMTISLTLSGRSITKSLLSLNFFVVYLFILKLLLTVVVALV